VCGYYNQASLSTSCLIRGPQIIRFGKPDRWIYKEVTDNTYCGFRSNSFNYQNDPAPNENKYCESTNAQHEWIDCAAEGFNCVFSGTQIVRYGIGDINLYLPATNSIFCDQTTFGYINIRFGPRPRCAYRKETSIYPKIITRWVPCAEEGRICSFSGFKNVRYGIPGKWVVKKCKRGVYL